MKTNFSQIIKRNPHLIAREIDDEFLLFDIENGMLYKLNETAKVIWKTLSKPKSIKEISMFVAKKFTIEIETTQKDVDRFVKDYKDVFFVINDSTK